MATTDSVTANSAESPSFFAGLWRRWQAKRRRIRARQMAYVRFRLTREGFHFVGILIFIFIGAIIREINLLILLAGAMIGLLLLQWRFNVSTLVGLQVQRKVPRNTEVGKATEIDVQVWNPKLFLAAWLVLLEDRLQKIQPTRRRATQTGKTLFDVVRPKRSASSRYEIRFLDRGEYTIGPTILSTRFPLSLGLGWRTLENTSRILVHPRRGELTPGVRSFFQLEQLGQAKSSAKAGTQEGEFYGLRPWVTGDSKRWIHWRTTARLGQLSVRQFERQQRRQVSVILDLYEDGSEEAEQACEQAISFVATLADSSIKYTRDRLAIGIASTRQQTFTNVVSPVLVQSLLDYLATVQPAKEPDLKAAIRGLSIPLMNSPRLLVLSTRPKPEELTICDGGDPVMDRLLASLRIKWVDVSAGNLEPYFQWT